MHKVFKTKLVDLCLKISIVVVLLSVLLFGFKAFAASETKDIVSRTLIVLDGKYLTACVPKNAVEQLKPLAARLDKVFGIMCKEAGYTPSKKLVLYISDETDYLNGWAGVLPRPVSAVFLSPGSEGDFFMGGERRIEFIAIHEFTHILNMDPVHGFRKTLGKIFGRVLPGDIVSMLLFYYTVPPQATMPTFWLEGLAQWAETEYMPADDVWAGRGRDPYVHMIWRLDALDGKIPEVSDWRASYVHWPYGSRMYNYGLAYTRYLTGAYSDKADLWEIAMNQTKAKPFMFSSAPRLLLGKGHNVLTQEARAALYKEQTANINKLKKAPITEMKRLTPRDYIFNKPAWTSDNRLLVCSYRPYSSKQRYVYLDINGKMKPSKIGAYDNSEPVRRSPAGALVTSNFIINSKMHIRNQVILIKPNGKVIRLGLRLVQPDFSEKVFDGNDGLAAVKFVGDGTHEIRLYKLIKKRIKFLKTVPAKGLPWNPVFRPNPNGAAKELLWVENNEKEVSLVMAPLNDLTNRKILVTVKARILHPCFNSTGDELFYASDVSGVFNAYRITLNSNNVSKPLAVTNTLGGVTACVPSPDSKQLAILNYDSGGPYISRIANDPASFSKKVPAIDISWPAPAAKDKYVARDWKKLEPYKKEDTSYLKESAYHGLTRLELLYWNPSTFVTSTGGNGLEAYFGDPLDTHMTFLGVGAGSIYNRPVGQLNYNYMGLALGFLGLSGYGLESVYSEKIVAVNGDEFDYAEDIYGGTATLGLSLPHFERRTSINTTYGINDFRSIDDALEEYAGRTLTSLAAFTGREHYLEVSLSHNNISVYPMSYHVEDGALLDLTHRVSGRGLGGNLNRSRSIGTLGYIASIFPEAGHQIDARCFAGRSRGDTNYLQGVFNIGAQSYNGLDIPRGYNDTEASGQYAGGYRGAYRFPAFRMFKAFGSGLFEVRQAVVEGFFDAGKISTDKAFGDGDWFRSAGSELTVDMEFWRMPLRMGLGVAQQLDGDEDTTATIVIRGYWD